MDIDVPLDDVIAKKRSRATRGRGSTGRGRGRGSVTRTVSDRSNVREKYSGSVPAQTTTKSPLAGLPGDGSKIVVSNLPDDVSENQIRELFDSTVGRVKRIQLSYKADGKSSGVATIEFSKPGDGSKAFAAYNGRLIDQKRPMKVEIIVDPSRIPPPPLSSRVAPAKKAPALPAATQEPAQQASASKYGTPSQKRTRSERDSSGEGGSNRRGRAGRGRGRRGGKGGREARPAATAEELDAEMDAYAKGDAASSATA